MKADARLVNAFLRGFFGLFCRIHRVNFDQFPKTGPCLVVGNHVNFLEVPLMMALVDNPNITGMAKRETWNNPLFRFLFNTWEAIPIDREAIDREAFRQALEALNRGMVLVVAPEGTRSGDGCLQQGKPGVTILAARSRAPLVAVAVYGHEHFWDNFKRLRRTDFHIVVGSPFRLNFEGESPAREARQRATDEIMYKIAELLPEKYRGQYQYNEPVEYQYCTAPKL
jgi:1-acyl-sn-glycerol-3-phosphate acyltransferase